MTETLRFTKLYKEDLSLGTGTEEVTLADGRVVTLSRIDIQALVEAITSLSLTTPTLTNATLTGTSLTSPTITTPTITTPTIASDEWANATHDHAAAAGGGTIALSDTTETLAVARGGSGAITLTGVLIGNGASAFTVITEPSGTLVGTTDTQTLTNKTLTSPTVSNPTISGVAPSTPVANVLYADTVVKGWLNFSYSASVPSIDADVNVSGLSDDGTGNIGVTLVADFSGTDWCVAGSSESNPEFIAGTALAAGSCSIRITDHTGVAVDTNGNAIFIGSQ